MLVDSHCHLDFADFKEDFSLILERAKNNDVQIMQTICTKISEFPNILDIANNYEQIYCSIGNHPCDVVNEGQISLKELVEYTKHPKVIGIGETGLDYYHDKTTREIQIESFKTHIYASRDTGLPIIIHSRDAEEDILDILKTEYQRDKFTGVIHCFTGTEAFAREVLKLGFYISISGIVTFKSATILQNIIKDLPIDRILIETDSPYLAPIPNRGKRNEPAFVKHTAEFIADLRNISFKEIESATTENFFRLFNKAQK